MEIIFERYQKKTVSDIPSETNGILNSNLCQRIKKGGGVRRFLTPCKGTQLNLQCSG